VNIITIMEDAITVNNTVSYYLKCSYFNHDKASPPNGWKYRLKYHLEKYHLITRILYLGFGK